jgi:hypothetical protein
VQAANCQDSDKDVFSLLAFPTQKRSRSPAITSSAH